MAVGLKNDYAIGRDTTLLPWGETAYRFELRNGDNTIEGLFPGQKVARAELSYCYAVASDYKDEAAFEQACRRKTVHYSGKGACTQGAHMEYAFRIFVPGNMNSNADVIFAQWHGMPTRTLIADAEGNYLRPDNNAFADAEKNIVFRKGIGYKEGKPNGWTVDHGGRPVLAFGFADGFFYVKANSDRKWLTDTKELCDAEVGLAEVMVPVSTRFKSSTIISRLSWKAFPKDMWVTFKINVRWASYSEKLNTVDSPGKISIDMEWEDSGKRKVCTLLCDRTVEVGRNDEDGYYFKCGAYRQPGSDTPICYYISGYREREVIKK